MIGWPWWIWPVGIAGGAVVLSLFTLVFRVVSRLAYRSWNPSKKG